VSAAVIELPATTITDMLIGSVRPFGPNGEPSAIDKHRVTAPLQLTATGLEGDEHGDLQHHGGLDKAVHHYPAEHYQAWSADLPQMLATSLRTGAFGENFSSVGLTEVNVCLGDVFRLGGAILQVSQARQPCWKLNVRFNEPQMSQRVQDKGRTGWYYRVLTIGEVAPGDELELLERPHPDWPLARLLHYFYADPLNKAELSAIAALAVLAPSWRRVAEQRLQSGQVEDWSRRLYGTGTGEAAT
jgi:MOSC domain-containing protein YiiM